MWWHLCTGTVLNSLPLFFKTTVPRNTKAEDTGALGSLDSRGQPHPSAGLHLKIIFRPVLTIVPASRGSSPVSGAIGDVQGKALSCVYFSGPRRSLAPSLQIGLCGFSAFHSPPLSQLPKVTAQILPSALRGGDVTR